MKKTMTPLMVKEKTDFLSAVKLFAKTRAEGDLGWLAELREQAKTHFERLDFPTTSHEEWKYTNIAPIIKTPFRQVFDLDLHGITIEDIKRFTFTETRTSLLVFINGLFAPELSDLSGLPGEIIANNFADVSAEHASLLRNHLGLYADYRDEVFTALNTSMIGDGAFVYIPDGHTIEAPIHMLFIAMAPEANTVTYPRALIVVGRNAMATIIESYVSLAEDVYFTNAVTEAFVAQGAQLDHYRLQEESERSFHIATTQVYQERQSSYRSCAVSLGAELGRHNLKLTLADEYTESIIDGLYVASGHQHIDNQTAIDHRRPHCVSSQLYKGILDGRARAVFNGKVLVHEGAVLTNSRQLNKNLMLSNEALVYTKPQLEIFADDVKCAHGATVGQLEDEELFYLASRGIGAERARALLTYGFAEEMIGKIRLASVRAQLDQMVLDKLHQSL